MLVTPSGPRADAASGNGSSTSLRAARNAQSEDELLALLLINTWTLTTGRILRSDVPPQQLRADELIEFWADDDTASADHRTVPTPAGRTGHHGRGAEECLPSAPRPS